MRRRRRTCFLRHGRNTLPRALQVLLPERHIAVTRRHSENVSRDRPRNTPHRRREGLHFSRCPGSRGLRLRPDHHTSVLRTAGDDIARHARRGRPGYVSHPVRVPGGGVMGAPLFFPLRLPYRASAYAYCWSGAKRVLVVQRKCDFTVSLCGVKQPNRNEFFCQGFGLTAFELLWMHTLWQFSDA